MNRNSRRTFMQNSAGAIAGALALPSLSHAIQQTTSPYIRPKLKITDVRTAEVMVHGWQTHVRIYTDQGLIGQGEATDAAVGTASLVRTFRRFLIGKDPLNVDALWEQMR
ncbi:MAG: twin-arginine translocation signal domain-containing protein, partial [Acidobacteriaceae bacterium]|nr:twin-arginine translocation signal domain-containing protein [Acidobacteriaceae bacterium]